MRSEPAGARVFLDREFRGLTPLRIPFHHYGVREVAVEKAGFGRQVRETTLWPPWFGLFPLDAVFDCLLPFLVTDRRMIEFRLEEHGKAGAGDRGEREGLVARAEAAREAAGETGK